MVMDLVASVILLIHTNKQDLPKKVSLSEHSISLEKRYGNSFVNDVFKDNILLNLAYMRGLVTEGSKVDWKTVRQPFTFDVKLAPAEVFAFHDDVLPVYKTKNLKTTKAHFNSQEEFKSDGYLVGDGVCHLASLIYWAAKDADLQTEAPTNHNFAVIPEIPKQYGVAIYYAKESLSSSLQNLYVTNNKKDNIEFEFNYDGKDLSVKVLQKGQS